MTAAPPPIISDLITRFREHADAYHAGRYNETQIRREFIDPLFSALGWDVDNSQGYAEAYKDVIHEDAIKIGGATKAPDYCFRIGGVRKFFVEAKKPSVNIKADPGPAFQLRRYAWSAKLPLSILTDFEELAVYDCRIRPVKTDKAAKARTLYIRYDELLDRWDELASIFSREAILKGSFDKYVESSRRKKGTAEVDDAFLAEIELWRETLARNFALRNPGLSSRDLNFAVQRTIDRIIFLRICEDRGIEQYGTLRAQTGGTHVYARLFERFRRADERYNSGLFHFMREKDRPEAPDDLTPELILDDKPLKDILSRLYYPESPYEFSVLPADILGQVYEQFLGKVIRLTAGHQARIEEKPEVRKAGGVYYTPTYIVDYIVKHTVGKLVEGKTPQQVGGLTKDYKPRRAKGVRPLAVLDPACGSGSFLLGAYQFLLDWYRDRYVEDGPKSHAAGKAPRLFEHRSGEWRLTTAERKRILLAHIHGVDIDSQAVETTKLSLLLKVLEGESAERLDATRRLFHERALPDLGSNIKCGNSLIGPDFYNGRQMSMFDEEERLRINVFDWKTEFKEVMQGGGFDGVIGNPPYIRIQTMRDTAPDTIGYYKRRYTAAGKGNYDIYVLFIERGLHLLNKDGHSGFILPHKFFNAQYGRSIRTVLSTGRHVTHVVHFGHQQVFTGATTYTCLLFLDKSGAQSALFCKIDDLAVWRSTGDAESGSIPADHFGPDEWNIAVGESANVVMRLSSIPTKLGDVATVFVGLQTSADDVFIMRLVHSDDDSVTLWSDSLKCEVTLEPELLHPLASGTDVRRFAPLSNRQCILFPYNVERSQETALLIAFEDLTSRFPKTAAYLTKNRKRLEQRERGKFRDHAWYRFGRSQNLGIQHRSKMCIPRLVKHLLATVDMEGTHYLDNVDVGGITWRKGFDNHSLLYLLGILNSACLKWYFPFVSAPFRGGWLSANRQFVSQVPIRVIDFHNPAERTQHDRMVSLVETMLDLHKQLPAARTGHGKTVIQRQIDATDGQIDQLVYELYGLSDEEIRIVEEAR